MLVEPPDFLAHGFEHDPKHFESATPVIQKALTTASNENIEDIEQLEELVRRAMNTWAGRQRKRSPLIIPVIVDA